MGSTSNSKKRLQDDESLKSESKNWNADQWEAYLKTQEVGLAESLSSKREVERSGQPANIFDLASSNCSPELSKIVESLLSQLSERQAFVMRKVFWDGRSERQIARQMGISRQAVYDLKKRALKNLRKHAQGVLATSPIVDAQVLLIAEQLETTGETPAA